MIPLSYKSVNNSKSETPENPAYDVLTQELLLKAEAISHVGNWEYNIVSNRLTWSDECFRICGFDPGAMVPDMQTALGMIHQEDAEKIQQAIQSAMHAGKEYKLEIRVVRPGGEVRFVISQGQVLFDDENKPERIFGILHDITEQKEIAIALEEKRQIYKSLFEQNPNAVYSFDLDGNFLSANESLSKITDCSVEEMLKISFIPFIDPDDLERVFSHFTKAGQGEIQNYNARYISAKGKRGHVNITNFPIKVNDKIIGVYGVARDITSELKAEAELKRKEELQKIMDQSIDVICSIDEYGCFLKIGEACERLWGYKPEELIGTKFIHLVCSEDSDSTSQITYEILNGKEITNFENRYIRRDGSVIPIVWSARWDDTDRVMYCIGRDASERNEAQKKLESTNRKMNTVLDSITDGFYTLDKHWIVTYWNREAELITGVKSAAILGRSIWETYQDIVEVKIYDVYRKVMASRVSASLEEYLPHLDVWVELNVYPFEDGISVYFKEISERKIAAENIRISKERYDLVAKATNDAIWDWDIQTNDLHWGDGFKTLFGYDLNSLTITLDSWVTHIHPEDLNRVLAKIMASVYQSSELQWDDEYRYIRADGSYAFVYDRGFVIRDDNGQAMRMIGAMQDITERKHNEQALKELNVQVKKRAEELALSNAELEQFAYIASHDLQEPLRMVASFLTQLEKKYKDSLDDKGKQYIHFAVDGAVRMKQIILDLLEYSRVGRKSYEMEILDLNELLANTLQLNKEIITEKKAVIEYADLPAIKAARTPLQQVFQNLISNALKYQKEDSVPQVKIGFEELADFWQFSVSDNGIGINPEYAEKIFVLFKRLHSKDQYPGTGIGLAICKKIIENHQGMIRAEAAPNGGSVFYFTISK